MQTTLYYLLLFLGFFAFSFVSWRKFHEDYDPNAIFTLTLGFLMGGIPVWFLFARFFPAYSVWGFLLGGLAAGWYAARKMHFKVYEILDGVALGLVWFSLFFYIGFLIRFGWGKYFTNTLYLLVPILVLVCARYVFTGYRRFSWYPSGKIGFIGAAAGFSYFFLLLVVDFALSLVLSSPGKLVESGISLLAVVVFFSALYLRSGRREAQHLLTVFQQNKRKRKINGR